MFRLGEFMRVPDQFEGPFPRYEARIADGRLEHDPAQSDVAAALQTLYEKLTVKRLANKSSALGWMFAKRTRPELLRGLYIWGDVGRGKTMLMDLFFDTAPVQRRARVHFHEFMADVHERIHKHRKAVKDGKMKGEDPIPPVAAAIATSTRLLCFDEFQVTDIADAMILGRLFTQLFQAGVTVVATSNVAPDNLYRNGLNRDLFLPFIDLLKQHVDEVQLDARTDFRLEKLEGAPVYYQPLGPEAGKGVDAAWSRLTGGDEGRPSSVSIHGRTIPVPRTALGAARFNFSDLCEAPLAAADFLKIAHTYHSIVLEGIPLMQAAQRNEARRFVWLIDALYDNGVKLIASAAGEPDALYPSGDTAFEFQRTASRLIEMRGHDYLALPHGKLGQTDKTEEYPPEGGVLNP